LSFVHTGRPRSIDTVAIVNIMISATKKPKT